MARARNLTIQEFAELSAELARPFADRRAILERGGLDESSWASTKEGMVLFMAARMKAHDLGAIEAYRVAFAGVGPRPAEMHQPSPSSPPAPREEASQDAPARALIPSYLLPEREAQRQPMPPAQERPRPAPVLQATQARPSAPLPEGQVETDEMDMSAFRGGSATPFPSGPGPDAARRAEQQRTDEKLQSHDRAVIARMQEAFAGVALDATRPADASDLRKPLPFGEAKAPEPPPRPVVQKPPAALVETTYLPEGSAAAEPKPFEAKAGRHPPTLHLPAPLPQQSGFTRGPTPAGRKSLPFQRGGPSTEIAIPAGWTIARYAVLCIDLNVSGMSEREVLQAAGITLEERRALDAHWEQRMLADPALRQEWKTHADRRGAELSKGRR